MSKLLAIIDLDSMLHIVAAVQYGSGNRDRPEVVKSHVHRFISTICKNTGSEKVLMLYQNKGHKNFRNVILPEYKGHRVPSPQILLWKDTIIEAFNEAGAYPLNVIETDDAMSILAEYVGYDKTLLVTADKDMQQVPTQFYNPFKKNLTFEQRWGSASVYQAIRFFWEQVLAGDPTDMPGELCGIEGVGMGKASKMHDNDSGYQEVIAKEYTKKYGKGGFSRANLTYKMVRLLKLSDLESTYASDEAIEEIKYLISDYPDFIDTVTDTVAELFEKTIKADPTSLFKK
jgi:5'-3' exonuclease